MIQYILLFMKYFQEQGFTQRPARPSFRRAIFRLDGYFYNWTGLKLTCNPSKIYPKSSISFHQFTQTTVTTIQAYHLTWLYERFIVGSLHGEPARAVHEMTKSLKKVWSEPRGGQGAY